MWYKYEQIVIKRGLHYLIRKCYFILVYGFHKVFLITFVPLNFKQSSAIRSTSLSQLQYASHSPVTCRPQFRGSFILQQTNNSRGPKMMLHSLVVNENRYDLYPRE